jgi:hypothetical protein
MKCKDLLGILAMVAASGCMNLQLLSEMNLFDAGEEEGVSGSGDSDGDSDGDTDGPPDTDADDSVPPMLITGACGVFESMSDGVCVAAGPVSASFRFETHEPAIVTISSSSSGSASVLTAQWATEHHAAVVLPDEGVASSVTLSFEDVNENADQVVLDVTATGGYPVAVTEILADPNGAEPDQEFVEVHNFGATAVDLSGWMIDDNGDHDGDLLPVGTTLGAGSTGIIVSPDFDPSAGDDPAPASSATIIYLDSSIGTSGLRNSSAETVQLWDAAGVLVSEYLGQVGNPKEGKSAARLSAELPDEDEWAWGPDPLDPPTPGVVPTL